LASEGIWPRPSRRAMAPNCWGGLLDLGRRSVRPRGPFLALRPWCSSLEALMAIGAFAGALRLNLRRFSRDTGAAFRKFLSLELG